MQTDCTATPSPTLATPRPTSGRSRPSPRFRTRLPAAPTPDTVYHARTGEWTGQLPAPELAVEPKRAKPTPDNTLHSLLRWAMSLKLSLRAQATLIAIISHVDWKTGGACYASVETLADEARLSKRQLYTQLDTLKALGIIGRRRRKLGNAETWLVVGEAPHQEEMHFDAGEADQQAPSTDVRHAAGDTSRSAAGDTSRSAAGVGSLTSSSSTNPLNQSVPVPQPKVVDQPEQNNGSDFGVRRRTSTEEESAPPPAPPTLAAEVSLFMSRVPQQPDPGFALAMLNRYWKVWGAEHVKGGWQCPPQKAAEEYCKSSSMWAKFRSDLQGKVIKLGPPPMLEDGRMKPEPVWCDTCRDWTTTATGPVFKRSRGSALYPAGDRITDSCPECPESTLAIARR